MASTLLQTDVALHRILTGGRIAHKLEAWAEAERERIGLWLPVMLGIGIIAWFLLPTPNGWLGWIILWCVVALAGQGMRAGTRLRTIVVGAGLLMALGCALVWAKALLVGQPPLQRPVHAAFVARVIAVEPQPALGRTRLLLAPQEAAALGLPARVRLNVAEADMPPRTVLGAGALVSTRARLMPPAPPAVPGAYNFAMQAYFSGIGATGRALPPLRVVSPAVPGGIAEQRADLSRHINARLPDGEGGIAAALATGDRGGISVADEDAMRRSGLAHLLSISGLHVSALIAGVILIVYRLLALSTVLALRWPLLLIAGGAGATSGIAYTVFTGAQVPTVRSCIAALLVLAGLAMGREAISLRLIAVGGFAVLLFWPESLMGPSFQMSFAAVTVIVALAESRWYRAAFQTRDEGWMARLARHLGAIFVTGLAVEGALIPIALAHFHQAGALGAFANLLAIPLTTFVIMPAEAGALAFDLVGLGTPFWWVAGKALGLLLAVAHGVARSPAALWALPYAGSLPFGLMMAGGLWFLFWRTAGRLAGLAPLAVGAAMMMHAPVPDLLVTGDGRHMMVRQADGSLSLLRGRAGDYVRDTLAQSAGEGDMRPGGGMDAPIFPALADARNARCSRDICTVLMRGDERDWLVVATLSNVRVPWRALTELCARADIVVSERRLPTACIPRWLKLDRPRLRESGGVAVYLEGGRWESVFTPGDRHPWVPASFAPYAAAAARTITPGGAQGSP
ncbi:MAG: ComEC/Rec2 family competence protein [Sphingobium sp.]|nr:ComEC/Rec2 family competence protein [Sphingobium sp.]MBP6111500.1 ComEC/Rec2 family competence protein [Sphingobium sp.]MBP8669869.1 ComEC/Rec2 family competence protein [Sphingobium sp.]MBP9156370.1 ComEC/Rec2 family competence protein [Sphingobium sp.]